jgi:hypothetical protein
LFFVSGSKFKAVDMKASACSFEAGIPKDLLCSSKASTAQPLCRDADGQRFFFVTAPKSIAPVPFVVVQNWQSALKH